VTPEERKARDDAQADSVFAVRDQDQVIAQIDTVSEDDLSSTFFGDSMDEVEDAATRMFDVGIRALGHDTPPGAHAGAFAGEPTGSPGTTAAGSPAAGRPAAPARLVTLVARLEGNPEAQRAFILGGPVAVGYR
jgi:hypothetical protein